ncbi:MAG: 30S ribosomal protein S7 [Armatimonadota bacterium]|nr:30S ribosomal protein S7 [Bacillota bacterium]MDQ7801212.1 30S ribosomal protein S7 [Armatimonadota bacterium]MDR5676987.1 30S ribosomal protein S7 [Armatimonadota bacterium]MDR5690246.1 30S ribosomal protein S7 [Armatimonadota bacterium]MDR7390244.1 30S ribosomal protein S7 [Armatimonadota bacterium]
MPRKGPVPPRVIPPDVVYGNVMVQRLINKVMTRGKKTLAERIVYSALRNVEQRTGQPAVQVLEKALQNVMPLLEVKPRRVGGANYQVPVEVRPERRVSLGIRWLVEYARQRPERGMVEKLTREILDAAQGQGGAVKRKEEVHRMAEANKAFAHYRW